MVAGHLTGSVSRIVLDPAPARIYIRAMIRTLTIHATRRRRTVTACAAGRV
jgi:hypothetical protein